MRIVFHLLLATAAASTVGPAPAQAQDAPSLFSAASVWAMEYADDSCRLTRDFARGEDIVTLVLDRYQPGFALRVTLVSDALDRFDTQYRNRFKFAPLGPDITSMTFSHDGILDDGRKLYGLGQVSFVAPQPVDEATFEEQKVLAAQPYRPEDEAQAAQAIDSLVMTEGFTRDFVLELGSMAGPIRAMQECTSELVTHWGIDAERHRGMTRRAAPAEDPQGWSTPDMFPTRERRQRLRGNATVRVMIDATGKPTSCHVQRASESDGFNQAACAMLMERGRFEPALDAAGQPMASYWVTDFAFLPGASMAGSASRLR